MLYYVVLYVRHVLCAIALEYVGILLRKGVYRGCNTSPGILFIFSYVVQHAVIGDL